MKPFAVKATLAVAGAFSGIVLWGLAATALLLVYWIGFQVLYLGVLCGEGKLGLGWLTPPAAATQETISNSILFFTAFAFTWGLVLAGLIGAVIAVRTGTIWIRRFLLARRVIGAVRGRGNQTKQVD